MDEVLGKLDTLIKLTQENTAQVREIAGLLKEIKGLDSTCNCGLKNISIDDVVRIIQERSKNKYGVYVNDSTNSIT